MVLNPKKCSFVKHKVEVLGFIITPEGTLPNPENVKAVKDFPTPRNVTQVKSFLGKVSYFRKHIRSFSDIAEP